MRGDAAGALERFAGALCAGRRSRRGGAGPARDQPLAVAPEGGAGGDLQPGHRRRRGRARRGPWRRTCRCRCSRGPGRCCSRASTRCEPHPTPRRRPRCCCCASPASATCRLPAELARLLRDERDGAAGPVAPAPCAVPECAPLARRPARCPWRRNTAEPQAGEPRCRARVSRGTGHELSPSSSTVLARRRRGTAGRLAVSERAPDPVRAWSPRVCASPLACRPTSPAG